MTEYGGEVLDWDRIKHVYAELKRDYPHLAKEWSRHVRVVSDEGQCLIACAAHKALVVCCHVIPGAR